MNLHKDIKYNITIIYSAHLEFGICNPNELCNIIEKINPEIIFEEIQHDRFDAYYKEKSAYTLETDAINMYLSYHTIEHIPVDTYDFSNVNKERIDFMYRKISQNCSEYDPLFRQHLLMTFQNGFSYLNSDQCKDLFEKMHVIEEDTIKRLNDNDLFHLYNLWIETTNNRENEMLKNIYNYSQNHCYNNAIFIIGAEHGKSILDKIQEYERKNEFKINWK
jgi:hypothetical protein